MNANVNKVSRVLLDGIGIAVSVVAGIVALAFATPFAMRTVYTAWATWKNAMQEASLTVYWITSALVVCAFIFWLVAIRTFSYVKDCNGLSGKRFLLWKMLSKKVAPSIFVLAGAAYFLSYNSERIDLLTLLNTNVKYAHWVVSMMAALFAAVVSMMYMANDEDDADSYNERPDRALSKQDLLAGAEALKLCLKDLCGKLQICWEDCFESSPGAEDGTLVSLNFYESQEPQVDLLIRAFRKELASESPEAIAALGDASSDEGRVRFAVDVHKSFIFSHKYWSVDFLVRENSDRHFKITEDSQP